MAHEARKTYEGNGKKRNQYRRVHCLRGEKPLAAVWSLMRVSCGPIQKLGHIHWLETRGGMPRKSITRGAPDVGRWLPPNGPSLQQKFRHSILLTVSHAGGSARWGWSEGGNALVVCVYIRADESVINRRWLGSAEAGGGRTGRRRSRVAVKVAAAVSYCGHRQRASCIIAMPCVWPARDGESPRSSLRFISTSTLQ